MSNQTKQIDPASVLFLMFLFLFPIYLFIEGVIEKIKEPNTNPIKIQAVEKGYAEFNSKTGKFQWKSIENTKDVIKND